jgi:hypothetical protein
VQIHENLGVPFFTAHIGVLAKSFDTKLADAMIPSVRQVADISAE